MECELAGVRPWPLWLRMLNSECAPKALLSMYTMYTQEEMDRLERMEKRKKEQAEVAARGPSGFLNLGRTQELNM
eukprot:1186864-Prorocentrum_minimum.AAC.9